MKSQMITSYGIGQNDHANLLKDIMKQHWAYLLGGLVAVQDTYMTYHFIAWSPENVYDSTASASKPVNDWIIERIGL